MNDSLCESLSKSARVEPSPIAQPLSSAALAKLWLIFAASSDPPVIELTKNGALIFFPKKDVSRLISSKLISGSALWINEMPSNPVVLFTPSTFSFKHKSICSVLR